MATGKKKDPFEEQRNHESRPLASLKDPDSFGPPPKHSAYYGPNASSPRGSHSSTGGGGGLGSAVPAPSRRQTQQEEVVEEAPKPPPGPYRVDTTGLSTTGLPAPPVRRAGTGSPAPAPPPRATPSLPPRAPPRNTGAPTPPPLLPPRQNEYPDEHTPAPPPTYGEATQPPQQPNAATLNQGALNRLGQAGVSVPGFGIGNSASPPAQSPSATQGHPTQLNELQQRFARMGTGSPRPQSPAQSQAPATPTWQQARQGLQTVASSSAAPAIANKKPAPPPPPKKSSLGGGGGGAGGDAPPPIPMSSKPRPS